MLRRIMLKLFSATYNGTGFAWLSWWHLSYMAVIFGTAITVSRCVSKRRKTAREMVRFLGYLIPAVYVSDFFLMPFASEDAGIEVIKLPFHVCTMLAVVIPFVQFNQRFCRWKPSVAVISVTCSGLFLLYPGTAVGYCDPWCYPVIQTMFFHGVMFLWGVLTITSTEVSVSFQTLKPIVAVTGLIVIWASFGNAAYSHGETQYDWFMLTGRCLPFELPSNVKEALPFILPFAVFGVVIGVSALVIAVCRQNPNNKNKTAHAS